MSTPKVSIVTPFWNAGPYLRAAIDSVLAQTVSDWELILVDDGSTDEGPAIATDAAIRDPRIRVLAPSDRSPGGAAAARNRGIGEARGEFLAFLDADDTFEPHMLKATLAAFERHPGIVMVYGPTRWWHVDDLRQEWTEETDGRAGRVFAPPSLLISLILLEYGHGPCTCAVLLRRDVAVDLGGFEERFHLYEDQSLWAKVMLRHRVAVTGEVLARYRQHATSVSARAHDDGLYDRFGTHPARGVFLDWLETEIRFSGRSTARLRVALRLALSPYAQGTMPGVERDRMLLRIILKLGRRYRRLRKQVFLRLHLQP